MNNGFDLDELSYEERNNILFNADILNEEGRLTTGGLLIFGKSPQRYMPSISRPRVRPVRPDLWSGQQLPVALHLRVFFQPGGSGFA
ncbi:hypothetical protein H8E77_04915 [bacterium]|nr:hypothetical protein [bacterium]